MMRALKFVLFLSLLLNAAQGNTLNANDAQTCMELCASCDGKATFEHGICKCVVRDDDIKGRECVMRLKREAEDLGPGYSLDDLEAVERSARCHRLTSQRRIGSVDADRVASYFMNGGPMTGAPMVGSTNGACAPSSSDPMTGAINLSNASKSPPVQPEVAKQADSAVAKSPAAAAQSPTCSCSDHQPIVSSSSSHDSGYSPTIGAPQPYQTSYLPHMLGAVPHIIMAIPDAVMKAASHIPSYNPGKVGSAHHSPILTSLASSTHGVLQRLDKMVSPYASESHHDKTVGAPHKKSDGPHSSKPSSSSSKLVGAPASAPRADSTQIDDSMLQEVLAQQNSLLEALSHQLTKLSPQVEPSRSMQYAPVAPSQYVVGAPQPVAQYSTQPMVHYAPQPMIQYVPQPMVQPASQPMGQYVSQPMGQYVSQPMGQYVPQPMGQYVSQPMGQYCPDGSSILGSPKATESSPTSPMKTETVGAPKSDKVESDEAEKEAETDKKTEETKKTKEEESKKTKRETRTRSSSRKKRGDEKYEKKKDVVQVKSL